MVVTMVRPTGRQPISTGATSSPQARVCSRIVGGPGSTPAPRNPRGRRVLAWTRLRPRAGQDAADGSQGGPP